MNDNCKEIYDNAAAACTTLHGLERDCGRRQLRLLKDCLEEFSETDNKEIISDIKTLYGEVINLVSKYGRVDEIIEIAL